MKSIKQNRIILIQYFVIIRNHQLSTTLFVKGDDHNCVCYLNASDLHPDTLQYQLPMIIIVHVQHQSVSNHFYSFGLFMIAK